MHRKRPSWTSFSCGYLTQRRVMKKSYSSTITILPTFGSFWTCLWWKYRPPLSYSYVHKDSLRIETVIKSLKKIGKIMNENWLSLNARNVYRYTYILYTLNLAYDIQSNLWFTDKDTSDYDATLSLPVNETSKLWSLLADTHIYIQFRLLSRVSKFVKLRCKFYFHILQGISQLNESIILKGANFTGFKLWPKSLMKERQWFKTFNTSKMNVRENTPFIINKWSFKCIGIFQTLIKNYVNLYERSNKQKCLRVHGLNQKSFMFQLNPFQKNTPNFKSRHVLIIIKRQGFLKKKILAYCCFETYFTQFKTVL